MHKQCAVYILANTTRAVLYIGATRDLAARIELHKKGTLHGFARKYGCRDMVYVALFDEWAEATVWERRLKKWNREWKENLITKENPQWRDLAADM